MTIETVKILRESADTYEERNKVYGDNFLKVGAIMSALFPNGLLVKTPDDWNRLHILVLGVVKQTRYVQNWDSGGHRDSIHDNTVYSAMLEAIDAEIAERPEPLDYAGAIERLEVTLKDLEEAREYAKGWSDRAKKAELELAAEKASRKLDGMPDYAPIPVCDPLPRNFVREMPPLVKGGDDGSSDMA